MIVVNCDYKSSTLININTGKQEVLSEHFELANEGKWMAEWDFDIESQEFNLSTYEDSRWVTYYTTANDGLKNGFEGGFWVGNDYYFKEITYANNTYQYYKVGKFGFDDIQPYLPPIEDTINKSDSIASDSVIE